MPSNTYCEDPYSLRVTKHNTDDYTILRTQGCKCGTMNPIEAFFCSKCGAKLREEPFDIKSLRPPNFRPLEDGELERINQIDEFTFSRSIIVANACQYCKYRDYHECEKHRFRLIKESLKSFVCNDFQYHEQFNSFIRCPRCNFKVEPNEDATCPVCNTLFSEVENKRLIEKINNEAEKSMKPSRWARFHELFLKISTASILLVLTIWTILIILK